MTGVLGLRPGSHAPDAGRAFEFVGEGTCTATCAHRKVLGSENLGALESSKRPGCVGFAYTYNTSACELHWAAPREITCTPCS